MLDQDTIVLTVLAILLFDLWSFVIDYIFDDTVKQTSIKKQFDLRRPPSLPLENDLRKLRVFMLDTMKNIVKKRHQRKATLFSSETLHVVASHYSMPGIVLAFVNLVK